ncbi:uncharacterized protein LOC142616363 [Castanea sativa]|uniref:uncharacterized protein LOC142616363 n=1 Tax=Castanea sativa TaxID=21020 RepID=UPI003F653E70
MIGSLLYLTASRPDISYSVGVCARYQSNLKESYMTALRIIKYVKTTADFGVWYSKDTNDALARYSDVDWAGNADDRKSTSRGCFYVGNNLVSWMSKKQNSISLSIVEAEYITAVSCFAKVARFLKMSGEVRSSELEIGLSSSDDHEVPKVTSPSTPYKAWNIPCALSGKDEKQIRDKFQFPDSVKIRISSDEDRACHSYTNEVCFYEADFTSGLPLPVHPFIRELFA